MKKASPFSITCINFSDFGSAFNIPVKVPTIIDVIRLSEAGYRDPKSFYGKFTKKNTEDLIDSINNQFKKIELNLQDFKIKRDEIEKIAGVDILTMSGEFKKVLGLLELQVKEYQLKRLTDEFIHQQTLYSQL